MFNTQAIPFVSLRALSHVLRREAQLRKLRQSLRKLIVGDFVVGLWEIRRQRREALDV